MTDNPHSVAVESCPDYDREAVYACIKALLKNIGFKIEPYKRVLLKSNLIAQNTPDQATTTHPVVVEAVCRLFKEKGCEVAIGDSSSFYQGGGTRKGFETAGYTEIAEKYGAKLLPFEATCLRHITSGRTLKSFYMTEAVFDHDLVINLPKLKIHRLARYTGAIKNLYGCIAGGTKQIYHKMFQARSDYQEYWGKPLVDVFQAVNPGLNIMDGIIGLDKDGPAANGEPRQTGVLLGSENGCALDVVACRMIGFDPMRVPAVREALERGLTHAEQIEVIGSLPSITYVKLPDLKPKKGILKRFDDYFFDQFIVTPKVKRSRCQQCGECIKHCAVSAIEMGPKESSRIDYEKCIYCYCCEEYCPNRAIYLHGTITNHMMRGLRRIMKL
jgi:uncharacterized protein (DUF362 family)/NAD-dependent dihydropyrimidine dehydrogenase PreA subunit